MTGAPALELEGIVKRFGEVVALDGASLLAERGTVHALLGENGAGKTTLMRVAFGLVRPDAGDIRMGGRPVHLHSPADAIAHGVGMVHQHFTLVSAMTVAENVALGGRGRYRVHDARERVLAIGRDTGLALDPDAIVATLQVSAQQRLEIVKALARGAKTLILDEPTAVLAPPEIADLLAMLRHFAASGGTAIIITHKLREALDTAQAVTVLRRGRTVAAMRAADATEEALAHAMLDDGTSAWSGDEPEHRVRIAHTRDEQAPHVNQRETLRSTGDVPHAIAISVHALEVRDERGSIRVRAATFDVRRGEIIGVAGVEGAGQRELLRALAGRLAPSGGTLEVPARTAFVPEDRQHEALVLDFALYENVALKDAGSARGVVAWPSIIARTTELLRRFDVRVPSVRALTRALSGGNQQKLVLGRELGDAPDAVIAENPTRGLDVAATAAVHGRLRAARDAGAAVVIYSSDLDEVLALAGRVLVMFNGEAREVPHDRDTVGRGMLGLQ